MHICACLEEHLKNGCQLLECRDHEGSLALHFFHIFFQKKKLIPLCLSHSPSRLRQHLQHRVMLESMTKKTKKTVIPRGLARRRALWAACYISFVV